MNGHCQGLTNIPAPVVLGNKKLSGDKIFYARLLQRTGIIVSALAHPLVKVMARYLLGVKALAAPMMIYCQMSHKEQTWLELQLEYQNHLSRKCIWKFCYGLNRITREWCDHLGYPDSKVHGANISLSQFNAEFIHTFNNKHQFWIHKYISKAVDVSCSIKNQNKSWTTFQILG